jgi:hypothetical protein
MDRDCHLHIIWGWRNGQWIVRYNSQECGAAANADQYSRNLLNNNWAKNGIIHQQINELPHRTWPGYIDSPDVVYYVVMYSWSAGMPDWSYEVGDITYPNIYPSSVQSSGTLEPPTENLPPAPHLENPLITTETKSDEYKLTGDVISEVDREKESDQMNWIVPVIAGVVGALLTGGAIWYSMKKEEEFGLIGPKGVRQAAEPTKGLYIWKVSLQVTSPSRPNLKHQLQYTVQARDKREAIEKAQTISNRDGNKVIDVVSVVKGLSIQDVHEPSIMSTHEPSVRMPKEVKQVVAVMQDNAVKAGQPEDSAYAGRNIENGEEVWVIGDNYERFDTNLAYKNGIWYYRPSYIGTDKPMKNGFREALANANIFYTG